MKNKENHVLITGASGFIGSHLTQRLVNEGYSVGIITRKKSKPSRLRNIIDKVKVYEADLLDSEEIFKIVSDFEPSTIFHLATHYVVEHQLEDVAPMLAANVAGTLNLLEASKNVGVELFVNTSSCMVYQASKEKVTETAPTDPPNLYSLTKLQSEEACTFYTKKYGFKTVTLRLFAPYGPSDHERRLIPYLIQYSLDGTKPKMTTGKQQWDFIYVDDIVDAYMKLLQNPTLPNGHTIFNIGGGVPVSIQELVAKLNEAGSTNLEPEWGAVPHRENEIWFMCADISKAKKYLDWEPKTPLEKGLKHTIKWNKKIQSGAL